MATQQTQRTTNGGFLGHVQRMIETHPEAPAVEIEALRNCIEACFDCAQACIACADACLGETDPKALLACIRINQDCADVCDATGKILSRQTIVDRAFVDSVLRACMDVCQACAEECTRHARRHEHCRVCAEACRRCERSCAGLRPG